jgi:hypothetical protein
VSVECEPHPFRQQIQLCHQRGLAVGCSRQIQLKEAHLGMVIQGISHSHTRRDCHHENLAGKCKAYEPPVSFALRGHQCASLSRAPASYRRCRCTGDAHAVTKLWATRDLCKRGSRWQSLRLWRQPIRTRVIASGNDHHLS